MTHDSAGLPTFSWRAAAALTAAWLLTIGALLMWVMRTTGGMLREQLKSIQFWSLEACVILGVALGAVVARNHLKRLSRRDRLRMAGLSAVALALTLFVAPRTNRIYYDEQIYQGIGQNLADLRLAQMCNDGTVEYGRLQCWSGEYNKQPYAFPHVLSLVYRAVGVRPAAAFVVNAVVMAMTVSMVYLLVLMLFDDGIAAFYAGLLVALIPEQLVWSATLPRSNRRPLCSCVAAIAASVHFIDREARSPRPRGGVGCVCRSVSTRVVVGSSNHRVVALASRERRMQTRETVVVRPLVRGARDAPRRPPVRRQK